MTTTVLKEPTRSQEAWRYVDVASLSEHSKLAAPSHWENHWDASLPSLPLADAKTCLLYQGQLQGESAVALCDASSLSVEQKQALEHLKQAQAVDYYAARHEDASDVTLHIQESSAEPLQVVAMHAGEGAESRSRVQIVVDPKVECRFVLVSTGNDDAYLANVEWLFHVGEGAKVSVQLCQQDGEKTMYLGGVSAQVESEAVFEAHSLPKPSALVRQRFYVDLVGEKSEAHLSGAGVVMGSETQHHQVVVNHRVGNAHSTQTFKTVLMGKSRSSFDGAIEVFRGADGTEADQLNRFLMLSEGARASAKPQLKIYADDVSCTHGATLGQLEDEEKFYLQSRGLDLATSEALLSRGFVAEVLEKSPIPEAIEAWKQGVFYPRFSIGEV